MQGHRRISVGIFRSHTDKKKEIKIFLLFKEIQSGAGAKSYMRKGFLIYEERRKYRHTVYEEAVIVIYDIACASFWISLYMRNFSFLFYQCSKYLLLFCLDDPDGVLRDFLRQSGVSEEVWVGLHQPVPQQPFRWV
jgi:hypothetical protein